MKKTEIIKNIETKIWIVKFVSQIQRTIMTAL